MVKSDRRRKLSKKDIQKLEATSAVVPVGVDPDTTDVDNLHNDADNEPDHNNTVNYDQVHSIPGAGADQVEWI